MSIDEMSGYNYEKALKGSHEEALAAKELIYQKIGSSGKKKEPMYKLQFSYIVLKQISQAIISKGTNYTIYCDIFEHILVVNVDPKCSPVYWNCFLSMTRYFYNLLYDRKLFPEMCIVFNWLTQQKHKLQNESDYEYVLGVYMQHLLAQKSAYEIDRDATQKIIENIYQNITELFQEMLIKNYELNFVYKNLITLFINFLIPKKSSTVYSYISSMPSKLKLFEAFFKLLTNLRMPLLSNEETHLLFIEYLEAFNIMFQIDLTSHKTEQISLKFLGISKSLIVFQSNRTMAYVISLLYYLMKLMFSQSEVNKFEQTYVELCGKFRNIFEKSGEMLTQEKWLMDIVVVLNLILYQVEELNSVVFNTFRKQLYKNSIMYSAHLELILSLIKLAPSIVYTKLTKWNCCTSTRKHIILQLTETSIRSYASYITENGLDDKTPANERDIHKVLISILRYGVRVINAMICINQTSTDLRSLYARFAYMLSKACTVSQVKFCINLTETLVLIQSKFTHEMWTTLLRRLRRAVATTRDSQLVTELYAIQIATMVKEKHLNYSALTQQISVFYTIEYLVWNACLLEILENSNSLLKPVLQTREKRYLYSAETQVVFKYQKTNFVLHKSLLKYAQNKLDFVLVARQAKQTDTHSELLEMYHEFKQKMFGLKRIEKLIMGHLCTAIVSQQVTNSKKIFDCQMKDCVEDNLEELLLKEDLKLIDVVCEINLVDITLEGVKLFEEFFNMADLEFISSEEALIDWETFVEDVSFLARLLQYRGYIENACQTWILLYRVSKFLNDTNNVMRSMAVLCEHSSFTENCSNLNLRDEISDNAHIILCSLQDIQCFIPRRQNYLFLNICQLAFFYARLGNIDYAYMLLKFVEIKRNELPERVGRFDFILASLEVVKFRILWKLMDNAERKLTHSKSLLREIETTLDNFRGFVSITSEDSWNYQILLFGLMQEIVECAANRLCDNIINSFFNSILKAALETGSALRIVQILTMWALANLQMEYVDKAQMKLRIIDCVWRVRSVHDLMKTKISIKEHTTNLNDNILSLQINPGMETMRKVVQSQFSPIKTEKVIFMSSNDKVDLMRFVNHDTQVFAKSDILKWSYISLGCMNARLMFLIEEYAQLDDFYEKCMEWCEKQKCRSLKLSFQNIHLMSLQHYTNCLRAHKKYDDALSLVDSALDYCKGAKHNVDMVYKINFELQKCTTKLQIFKEDGGKKKLRRALIFNTCVIDNEEKIHKPNFVTNKFSPQLHKPENCYVDTTKSDLKNKIICNDNGFDKSESFKDICNINSLDTHIQQQNPKTNLSHLKNDYTLAKVEFKVDDDLELPKVGKNIKEYQMRKNYKKSYVTDIGKNLDNEKFNQITNINYVNDFVVISDDENNPTYNEDKCTIKKYTLNKDQKLTKIDFKDCGAKRTQIRTTSTTLCSVTRIAMDKKKLFDLNTRGPSEQKVDIIEDSPEKPITKRVLRSTKSACGGDVFTATTTRSRAKLVTEGITEPQHLAPKRVTRIRKQMS